MTSLPEKNDPTLNAGDFVQVRGRSWLVESIENSQEGLNPVSLSCVDDDAQGEFLRILWEAEVDGKHLGQNMWSDIATRGSDDPQVFGAFLKTLGWNTATSSDRNLFQAPFRAGIRLDAYQLLPLQKALHLPRVNLLIADDVGLGKTIEAGLILRELLLRRRLDKILVAAPPSMTIQWQEELEQKFGLSFAIIDRERLTWMRRTNGFLVNPWGTGSRFILSHSLMIDETYVSGLRDVLGDFCPRTLLILDEAHHAAPSSGSRYAVDSQFTKAVRDLAARFEHRIFLTATPHNGHSNSFSSLLEMLDPQRFTRGVEIRPTDLRPVMVRRLKSDLRGLGEKFPERIIEQVQFDGLPEDTPELVLARMLSDYGVLRDQRLKELSLRKAAQARIVFVGLQQRLLSSMPAFLKTLRRHFETLKKCMESEVNLQHSSKVAEDFVAEKSSDDQAQLDLSEEQSKELLQAEDIPLDEEEKVVIDAATTLGAQGAVKSQLEQELRIVKAMIDFASKHASRPDERMRWLTNWVNENMLDQQAWNKRRLIIFTEYEDTRRWLERQLKNVIAETDKADERIGVFSGATGKDRREQIKQAFNANPAEEPLRILLCTDAAREGINLQTRCHDLIHFDLPWNPSRLEQRNGRIDRKLQPSDKVTCYYFTYNQRPEDIVLKALVDKTETIRLELGAIGSVIESRILSKLTSGGIRRGNEGDLVQDLKDTGFKGQKRIKQELEENNEAAARHERLLKEQESLRSALEKARKRVGVESEELQRVVGIALNRDGVVLDDIKHSDIPATGEAARPVSTFLLNPDDAAFAKDRSWNDAFDDLRSRRRKRGERFAEWRREAPVRAISFEPPIMPDDSTAENVVQVHLEHRLVRRLLSRFMSHGFQSELNRACVILGPGAQPRVVLLGRLLLYGDKAARLHEEIIPITAIWKESGRDSQPLKPFGKGGESTTLEQLEKALKDGRMPPQSATQRATAFAAQDIEDLRPELESRAKNLIEKVTKGLEKQGDDEAEALQELLQSQHDRIKKADDNFTSDQQLVFDDFIETADRKQIEIEKNQRLADRRYWQQKLERLTKEIEEEPQRVRETYRVKAHRIEPVGLVYLWPTSG